MAVRNKPDSGLPLPTEGAVVRALDCLSLLDATGPLPMIGVVHRRYSDLGPALLTELQPTRIILPLFAAG